MVLSGAQDKVLDPFFVGQSQYSDEEMSALKRHGVPVRHSKHRGGLAATGY